MSSDENLIKQKKRLIEEMGVYFESSGAMPPLSARIFAYMVVTGNKGVSFDDILEELQASKSSISTNLQLLQSNGRINYYTKPGERKRYFKIDDNHIITRINEKIDEWEKEKVLHLKVLDYKRTILKKENKPEENEKSISFNTIYLDHIETMITSLYKLKTNFLQIINQQ
ncbi:GbsR/MarR family transcriptional regulator [Abyssalbus ytuae]|uniref:MarR family transcriptional regulator n=1 Tax=Abyssalbus ytuae TaxID=2926907 RepID=A0A9E6ZQU0_9FLAO|nr:MarR family transcriptional regulator [Abyssalbus ytuae]UOB19234.1 MarR family transcriptional regulator [Abyssalbus ytuae]